jgi:DNA-binding transcriptional regulator YbjK
MASNKERALDAAIELVGTEGLRALTHARVDERAGLPKGSTSNYFRTRASLLAGVVEWMAEREISAMRAPADPATPAELVDMLCGLLAYTTGPNRTLTTARLVLFLEAAHNADIRVAVSRGRGLMEQWATSVLTRLGATDPAAAAAALMAASEGFILHRVARGDDTDPRAAIELIVRGAMAGPS